MSVQWQAHNDQSTTSGKMKTIITKTKTKPFKHHPILDAYSSTKNADPNPTSTSSCWQRSTQPQFTCQWNQTNAISKQTPLQVFNFTTEKTQKPKSPNQNNQKKLSWLDSSIFIKYPKQHKICGLNFPFIILRFPGNQTENNRNKIEGFRKSI